MQRRVLCAGLTMIVSISAANAQEVEQKADGAMLLETIIVTDGLTPVEQQKSGRAFTIITGEELEKNQVRYVADALRQVPGFSVSRMGSLGGQTQIRVRGAEANHLLVLIDGVEVSETSTGEFDFGSLLVDNIDRIEILRGPQSAFWGSNAMAGVVNIITKRGERDGLRATARSEIGTDGTLLTAGSLSGGGENYDVAITGAFRRTDGFNISDFGSEKDGDRNTTLNGKFTLDVTDDLTLDGTLRYVDRKSDADPQDYSYSGPPDYAPGPFHGLVIDRGDWTSTRELFGSIGATHAALDGALVQKARITGSDTSRDDLIDGTRSWNDGNRYNGTYQASYQWQAPAFLGSTHQITGGYEWEREAFSPSHLAETFVRESNSLVAEYRGEFLNQFYLNAGLRQDFNEDFGDATTYSLSGAWKIPNSETRLHASLGTGVTNPTFVEQFGFIPETFEGNPDLVPEKSFGWDIGIEQGFFNRGLVVDVTYFNQNLTDEIATVFGGPPDFISSAINRDGESKRQGLELSATIDFFNGFTATATYTYVDATEQTIADGPRFREVRRPAHSGSLSAAYVFHGDRARIFGEAVFNGEREDLAFVPSLPPRVTLDAYTVVNVGGSFKINDRLEAHARIENLFNEKYEEVFGYNTQGRAAFIGLRGTF